MAERCAETRRSGDQCKNPAFARGLCSPHLRQKGGHIWICDHSDSGCCQSYCRYCATIRSEETAREFCYIRTCGEPIPEFSPDLPKRLQYSFAAAKPAKRIPICMEGKKILVSGEIWGPFAICQHEAMWYLSHRETMAPVVRAAAKENLVLLVKDVLEEKYDLDFASLEEVSRKVRSEFYNDLRCRRYRDVIERVRGGFLTWPRGPYRIKPCMWPWENDVEVVAYGPFTIEEYASGFCLKNFGQYLGGGVAVLGVPKFEDAERLAQGLADLDLNWEYLPCRDDNGFLPETQIAVRNYLATVAEKMPIQYFLPELHPLKPVTADQTNTITITITIE